MDHYLHRAEQAVGQITARLSPPAAELMGRDDHFENARQYLRNRFMNLHINGSHEIRYNLNQFNKTHGLGFQSVEVDVYTPSGKSRLLPNELKAPTIGVVTRRLLPGAKQAVVDFSPAEEEAEEMNSLSGLTPLLADVQRKDGMDLLPTRDALMATPKNLIVNKKGGLRYPGRFVASGNRCESVRMILAQKDAPRSRIATILEKNGISAEGVYVCRYLADKKRTRTSVSDPSRG